jgi:hypothetical protein
MPTTSDEFLSDYMSDKNREALGEKVEGVKREDDNFLAEEVKLKQSFTEESAMEDDRVAGVYAIMKRILKTSLILPLLVGALGSIFYVLVRIGPLFLSFLRKMIIGIF